MQANPIPHLKHLNSSIDVCCEHSCRAFAYILMFRHISRPILSYRKKCTKYSTKIDSLIDRK